MIAKVCHEHEIVVVPENDQFRDICQDVLLSRAGLPQPESTRILWTLLNELMRDGLTQPNLFNKEEAFETAVSTLEIHALETGETAMSESIAPPFNESPVEAMAAQVPYEQEVYSYLQQVPDARASEIEAALGINRFQTVNALRSLTAKGMLNNHRSSSLSSPPSMRRMICASISCRTNSTTVSNSGASPAFALFAVWSE